MDNIKFSDLFLHFKIRSTKGGFTLIELILCILLTAIISYSFLPRFFNYNVFQKNLFTKKIYGTLYYAQNLAVGSGCHIAVTVDNNFIKLDLRDNCTNGSFIKNVQDPNNINNSYLKKAPTGIVMEHNNFPIYFDQNGQARSTSTDNTINASINIYSIEQDTINIQGSKGIIN